MANDSTATLPLPGTSPDNPLGMPPPTTQTPMRPPDPSRIQILKELLTKYGPAFANMMQGSQQQQGPTGVTPAVVPPVVSRQSTLPALEVKFDPMSVVGSLPQPVAQPQKGGYEPPAGTSELLSKLDPQSALTFSGIQGVTKFLQDNAQKKDQEKHAEAANAAQALISALESAKTTGDYRPAEHILENNEALFNKVYKGWLQKAEEAKKPQKQKPPDPEVEGFEKGLAAYLGKGAASQSGAPQPPATLTGKSGAKYFMPQAAPGQALQQQATSAESQATRQDPNRTLQSQLSSGEQRQAELGQAGLAITPAVQAKLNEYAVQYAKFDSENKKAELEAQKAQLAYETEVKKEGYASTEAQTKLTEAQINLQKANIQLDIAKQRGQIELQKSKNGGQIPAGYRQRWNAVTKAEELLKSASNRGLTKQESDSLTNLLGSGGATNLAKSVPGWFGRTFGGKDATLDLLKGVQEYKDALKDTLSKTPTWLDEGSDTSGDTTVDSTDDEIIVKPEDMK